METKKAIARKAARPVQPVKRTPTGRVLLVRPKKPPAWWPSAEDGWVTLVGGGRYDGWTVGVDRTHVVHKDDVEDMKDQFRQEMKTLRVGGWEFKTEVILDKRSAAKLERL